MVITMTRSEYEAKYGVAPVASSSNTFDNSPAPIRMTRAEYNSKYGTLLEQSLSKLTGATIRNTGVPLGSNIPNMPSVKDIVVTRRADNVGATPYQQVGNVVGLASELAFKGIEQIPVVGTAQKVIGKVFNDAIEWAGNKIGDIPAVQKFATSLSPEEFSSWQKNLKATSDIGTFALLATGAETSKLTVGDIATKAKELPTQLKSTVKDYTTQRAVQQNIESSNKVANEIANIESNYSKLRKQNEFSKDANASRQRIANTDVLVGAVDDTGTIRTIEPGGAVDQYSKLFIDGSESVVRDNLVRLKETVNLDQIKRDLISEIYDTGFEGSDLITALNGVKKELAGLKLRADEFGNIPLEVVHDAKINSTKHINFSTPPEVATYRKAVARSYKKLVEDNSSFNVSEVNGELSPYYEDLNRLKSLDGKKVKGGKLGRYTAKIAGNIAGGLAGLPLGPAGPAVTAVVGGELASHLVGRQMTSTFGKPRGLEVKTNPILEYAKQQGKLEPVVDLKKPDVKVGVPANIPKTKEITLLEKNIERNVEQQKKAIKAGDFTLVSHLKEVYKALVDKLKAIIKKVKETPNKQGGFIKNPLYSAKEGVSKPQPKLSESKSSYTQTTTKKTTQQGIRITPEIRARINSESPKFTKLDHKK